MDLLQYAAPSHPTDHSSATARTRVGAAFESLATSAKGPSPVRAAVPLPPIRAKSGQPAGTPGVLLASRSQSHHGSPGASAVAVAGPSPQPAPGATAHSGAFDRRRKCTRDFAERLVNRSIWLAPDDRALILCVFRDGLNATKVAELRHEPARLVRRRVRQLMARIGSPEFEFVVRRRDAWPAQRRRVATEVVLHGHTIQRAAEFLRMSFHAVRKEVAVIRAMAESAS